MRYLGQNWVIQFSDMDWRGYDILEDLVSDQEWMSNFSKLKSLLLR